MQIIISKFHRPCLQLVMVLTALLIGVSIGSSWAGQFAKIAGGM